MTRATTDIHYKLLPSPPRLAGLCIREAIRRKATEIEMTAESSRGTVRIEGEHKDALLRIPLPIWRAVLQTFKTIAGLDPADAGRPQQGRARYELEGMPCDLTVVTTPASGSESAMISITRAARTAALDDLNLNPGAVELIRSFLPGGGLMLLAGAQQTTAKVLGAMADELLRMGKDVVDLGGGGAREATGRPRGSARVAIVGRVSDAALAQAAIAAVLRGHLVVLAAPALDAMGAMQCLVEFGVDAQVMVELGPLVITLHGIRRLCRSCAAPIGRMSRSEERLSRQFGINTLFRAAGCSDCGGRGFAGTIPHAQIHLARDPIVIDDRRWAAELLARGKTSIEEVSRLLFGGQVFGSR